MNSPHKWPVTWKKFQSDDVIMCIPHYFVECNHLSIYEITDSDTKVLKDASVKIYVHCNWPIAVCQNIYMYCKRKPAVCSVEHVTLVAHSWTIMWVPYLRYILCSQFFHVYLSQSQWLNKNGILTCPIVSILCVYTAYKERKHWSRIKNYDLY